MIILVTLSLAALLFTIDLSDFLAVVLRLILAVILAVVSGFPSVAAIEGHLRTVLVVFRTGEEIRALPNHE